MKTARLAITLGSLCRDRFGAHYHPILDALRAVCRVSRVHVPCVTRECAVCSTILFLEKEKQAASPNSLGATLDFEFEDASSRLGKRSF